MTLTPRELRLGWTALALSAGAALMFDGAGWRLSAVWLALVIAGAIVLARPAGAARALEAAEETLGTPAGRLSLIGSRGAVRRRRPGLQHLRRAPLRHAARRGLPVGEHLEPHRARGACWSRPPPSVVRACWLSHRSSSCSTSRSLPASSACRRRPRGRRRATTASGPATCSASARPTNRWPAAPVPAGSSRWGTRSPGVSTSPTRTAPGPPCSSAA